MLPKRRGDATVSNAFASWSNAHQKIDVVTDSAKTPAWPTGVSPPKETAPCRETLAQLELVADDAKAASHRAQTELYDASSRLKQTESPLATASQNHGEQQQKVDAAVANLRAAEDQMQRADANYAPVAFSNDAAVRAKHSSGTAMSDLTHSVKAKAEEVLVAKQRVDELKLLLGNAETKRDSGVSLAALAADEMDKSERHLVNCDTQFRHMHGLVVKLSDELAAAKLVRDVTTPHLETLKTHLLEKKRDLEHARNALDVAAANQLRAVSIAEQSIAQVERVGKEHGLALGRFDLGEAFSKTVTSEKDALREQFQRAVSSASAVREKASATQQNFAEALARVYAARAELATKTHSVEVAVSILGDFEGLLEKASVAQDVASIDKQMAERLSARSGEIFDAAKKKASDYARLVVASEAVLDAEWASEAAHAEAQKARASADLSKKDISRVEHAWALAARVAEAEAAAVEGFSLETAAAKERANEAAALQRELHVQEANSAKERVAEQDKLRVLEMMEMAKRNRAMDMKSKTSGLAGKYAGGSGDAQTQRNNAVPLRRPFQFQDTVEDETSQPVSVGAVQSVGANEEDEETGMSIRKWFS